VAILLENVMQTAQETYLLHVIHVQINNYSVILDKECTTAATCGLHWKFMWPCACNL